MSGRPKFTIHDRGNGSSRDRLRYRIRVSGKYTRSGNIEYWSFRTKAEAEQSQAYLLNHLRKRGESAIIDSPASMTDAVLAKKLLEEAGLNLNLTEAVKKFLNLTTHPLGALKIQELFDQYATSKLEGWRTSSKSNFKTFAKIFLQAHSNQDASTLDSIELGRVTENGTEMKGVKDG